MQNRTEGEWYVAPSGLMVLARNDDGAHPIVAHVSLTRGNAEAVANAALLAAAPAMLAALEAAERHAEHLGQCRLCRGGFARICDAARDAESARRAALRQARQGQEQGVTP
jgi:hypothetical protein